MEDKTFELMTKMYSDITKGLDGIDSRLVNLEEGQKGLSNDITRLENEHGKKLDALFGGYIQTYEKLETIEEKLDNHEVRIQALEGSEILKKNELKKPVN